MLIGIGLFVGTDFLVSLFLITIKKRIKLTMLLIKEKRWRRKFSIVLNLFSSLREGVIFDKEIGAIASGKRKVFFICEQFLLCYH